MKRWLHKYGKCLIVALGVSFLSISIHGIFTAVDELTKGAFIFTAGMSVVIILLFSGIFWKLCDWWDSN